VAHARQAAQEAPADAGSLCALVSVLLDAGESAVARECLDRHSLPVCKNPLLLMHLATLRKRLDQHVEALDLLDRAKALGCNDPALRFMRGEALAYNGQLGEAEAELVSCLRDEPGRGRAAISLVRLHRQTPKHNYLSALELGALAARPGSDDRAAFEFARYKTLEDLGRYDEAWKALSSGNAMMHARLHHADTSDYSWLQRFVSACPPANPRHAAAQPAGPMPIFIIGMPRSGTTLLDRMLGNHPAVLAAGELLDFRKQFQWLADTRNIRTGTAVSQLPQLDFAALGQRYLAQTQWRAPAKAFFIDKQPPNWILAGIIHVALPSAPILNLVRDPMDVCFSNWRAYFGDACAYSYDMEAMATCFQAYRRTIAHWHRFMPDVILDVPYAGLVHDPDATLHRVFDFCGLEWEPGCADIGRNPTPSATLSAAQVRQSIRTDASGRWRRYAATLGPLLDSLKAT
jgi:tetratricopeptide (TPR) repeat protein